MTALEQAALEFAVAYLAKLVNDGPAYPVAQARSMLEECALAYARGKVLNELTDEAERLGLYPPTGKKR